jgi:modulator of FtsH protease HflC
MSKLQTWALALILPLILLGNSVYVLDQRTVAVLLQFDRYIGAVTEPGLHFKLPFAETVDKFDRRLQTDDDSDSVPTSDQKTLSVRYYVAWRIADVGVYYRATTGKDLFSTDRLNTVVKRSLRDTLGSRTLEQVVGGDQDQFNDALLHEAQAKARDLGIEVVDVRIVSMDLPKDVADAYYDRMRAERKRIADDLRARGNEEADAIKAAADSEAQTTLAEAYRKSETLRGEGDAKAAEIYAQSYGQDPEFFAFYRSLNAYRDAFAGKSDVLVVEPKGEFFKYFKDAGSAK